MTRVHCLRLQNRGARLTGERLEPEQVDGIRIEMKSAVLISMCPEQEQGGKKVSDNSECVESKEEGIRQSK